MIEVEVKARVRDRDELVEKLRSLGAEMTRRDEQRDTYFNSPHRDFARTDEALRIRKTGGRAFITYKGPKIDERSKTRKELEMEVDDPETAAGILEALGFFRAREVIKVRETYRLGISGRPSTP